MLTPVQLTHFWLSPWHSSVRQGGYSGHLNPNHNKPHRMIEIVIDFKTFLF